MFLPVPTLFTCTLPSVGSYAFVQPKVLHFMKLILMDNLLLFSMHIAYMTLLSGLKSVLDILKLRAHCV